MHSLDWSKIDNDKIFQRLVNHLFALECNSPGFIPSSPYIGADGGWDGKFSGKFEKKQGIFGIQAKWTQKNLKEAMQALKKELKGDKRKKGEVQKALDNNVDHLIIATPADLSVPQYDNLKEYIKVLNDQNATNHKLKTWDIWYREKLDRRIQYYPYLKKLFFDLGQFTKWIPVNKYFDKREPYLNENHIDNLEWFKKIKKKIIKFLLMESKNILIITGKSGYGKTHILSIMPYIVKKVLPEFQTWITCSGIGVTDKAIDEELLHQKKYLLLFDDLQTDINDFLKILPYINLNHFGENLKIIATCQNYFTFDIINEIENKELYIEYQIIKLSEWNKNDLFTLLRSINNQLSDYKAKQFIHFYRIPFLIVWIGKNIKKITDTKIQDIVYKISKKSRKYIIKALTSFSLSEEQIELLLNTLSILLPFDVRNEEINATISKELDISTNSLIKIFKELVTSELLIFTGNILRFNPDIIGYINLTQFLKDKSPNEIYKIINKWCNIHQNTVLRNLSTSEHFIKIEKFENILQALLREWTFDIEKKSYSEIMKILKLFEYICHIIPGDILKKLKIIINLNLVDQFTEIPLTMDNIEPILLRIKNLAFIRKDLLSFLSTDYSKLQEGYYSNYKFYDIIKLLFNPVYINLQSIQYSLELFDTWIDSTEITKIDIICIALSELLASSHEWTETYDDKIVFAERFLVGTENVINFRKQSLNLIKKMLNSKIKYTVLKSLDTIANHHGKQLYPVSKPNAKKPMLLNVIKDEKAELLKDICEFLSKNTENIHAICKIENILIDWLIHNNAEEALIIECLKMIDRTTEYIFTKCYISPYEVVYDINDFLNQIPNKERWKWFCDYKRSDCNDNSRYIKTIKLLNKENNNPVKIIKFLKKINAHLAQVEITSSLPILNQWIGENSIIFNKLYNEKEYRNKIPNRFYNTIEREILFNNKKIPLNVLNDLLKNSIEIDRFGNIILLIIYYIKDRKTLLKILKKQIKRRILYINDMILRYIQDIYKQYPKKSVIIKILIQIIKQKEYLIQTNLNHFSMAIDSIVEDIKIDFKKENKLRRLLLRRLLILPKLNRYINNYLLKYLVSDINGLLVFLKKRFKIRKVKNYSYRPIPFEGLDIITKIIKEYSEFKKLTNCLLYLRKNDLYEIYIKDIFNINLNQIIDDNGKNMLIRYLNELLENGKGKEKQIIFLIQFIDLENNIVLFRNAMKISIKFNYTDNFLKSITSHFFPPYYDKVKKLINYL